MPAKTKNPPKKSLQLEEETNKMENFVNQLKLQIEEERAKVNLTTGTRWAAAAEGPISKFDPHGTLAKNILRKKRSPRNTSTVETRVQAVNMDVESETFEREIYRPTEVIVEPQSGALWGEFTDTSLQSDQQGGALWNFPTQNKDSQESNLPPIGAGGSLWGPPPNEEDETRKFQEEVDRIRGITKKEDEPRIQNETKNEAINTSDIKREKLQPTAFTYFDKLYTKDILDDKRLIDQ